MKLLQHLAVCITAMWVCAFFVWASPFEMGILDFSWIVTALLIFVYVCNWQYDNWDEGRPALHWGDK